MYKKYNKNNKEKIQKRKAEYYNDVDNSKLYDINVGPEVYQEIILDEFAFVDNNKAEDFMKSVYPTISSGTTSKVFVFSTSNGMNHFYKLWTNAVEKKK